MGSKIIDPRLNIMYVYIYIYIYIHVHRLICLCIYLSIYLSIYLYENSSQPHIGNWKLFIFSIYYHFSYHQKHHQNYHQLYRKHMRLVFHRHGMFPKHNFLLVAINPARVGTITVANAPVMAKAKSKCASSS